MSYQCQFATLLQCLERCRAEVCAALGLQPSQLELSMGMSGDFEQAVSAVLSCCSRSILLLSCYWMFHARSAPHLIMHTWLCEVWLPG